MGSYSAANADIAAADHIDGVVLTSSVTRSKQKWKIYSSHPRRVLDLPLHRFVDPVLVVAPADDGCELTPAGDLDDLARAFSNASRVGKALFQGGGSPLSEPCKALSAHGFLGIRPPEKSHVVPSVGGAKYASRW
jgi:hypothetical protein